MSQRGMLFRLGDGTRSHPEARVDDVYQELKPLMFSIAYRMLGSATEAEDIVQEAFLRFHKETTGGTEVDSAKAYLSSVTTRLSIDHLRSARVRRERYVGTWLPEPILTEEEDDVALHAETADSLSMGFLVLLESLTSVERAVFLPARGVLDHEPRSCRRARIASSDTGSDEGGT